MTKSIIQYRDQIKNMREYLSELDQRKFTPHKLAQQDDFITPQNTPGPSIIRSSTTNLHTPKSHR